MLTSFTSFNFRIVSLSFISCSPAALPSISTSTSFFNSEALSPANLPTSVLQGDAVSNIVEKKINWDVENSLTNRPLRYIITYCIRVRQTICEKHLKIAALHRLYLLFYRNPWHKQMTQKICYLQIADFDTCHQPWHIGIFFPFLYWMS